ncbi:MAG TPA: redox-sensing transcriptional repressor Rex [Dongiaceae bacterium]|nr:redox-sensing transcriptional repressor Rex [Dongiaceae bacterium]
MKAKSESSKKNRLPAAINSPLPYRTPLADAPTPAGDKSSRAGLSCVKRLPAYLQLLRALQATGREHVSGTVLATVHHLEPVIVRKDLAITGIVGTPRIGFRVDELILAIERFLGWDNQTRALLVGVGNLGSALLGYRGFNDLGLQIVAAFDSDPRKIGRAIHSCRIQSLDKLPEYARRQNITLGVLTVPAESAQAAANVMVQAGIRGIWNFTPVKLQVPEGVVAQKEDLAEGLAVLSHRLRHSSQFQPQAHQNHPS